MIVKKQKPEFKFTVQEMIPEDLDSLVRLHEKYLNYGEGIRPHYAAVLTNPDTVAMKCLLDGEIVGIDIYTKGISLSGGHPELIEELKGRTQGQCVYTGDALLVRQAYRKMKVSEKLCAASKDALIKKGATRLIHELWVYPDGHVPALKVVKSFPSTEYVGRFEQFYKDFYHFGYLCPVCGAACSCSADIYITHVQ